jgi:hypothetical protein
MFDINNALSQQKVSADDLYTFFFFSDASGAGSASPQDGAEGSSGG